VGSLAIGISLALVLVESNQYNAVAFFPAAFGAFIAANLYQSSPIVDALLALLILGVSTLGLVRNLPRLQPGPGLRKFQTSVAITASWDSPSA
jgi:hypothetical protein